MSWFLLIFWLSMILTGTRTLAGIKRTRLTIACALTASMLTQLWLLHLDGLLRLETALPLHLCGLFGILSIPMLWHTPRFLWEASVFLASPAALCTLLFPAVMSCSHPLLMKLAFTQLHVLVGLAPLFLHRTGKPLPTDPRRTLIIGNGYLLFVAAFNRAFQTNYLFLRSAPAGTPLAVLFARGPLFYVCSLELLCMLIFTCLKSIFLTAGSRSSCSRYSRCTAPCTSRDRG